jgi:hypothetical protein
MRDAVFDDDEAGWPVLTDLLAVPPPDGHRCWTWELLALEAGVTAVRVADPERGWLPALERLQESRGGGVRVEGGASRIEVERLAQRAGGSDIVARLAG